MRSAMKATSLMSWLTMTMEVRDRVLVAQMSSTSARRDSAVRASTWLKGSSMNRISGLDGKGARDAGPLFHTAGKFAGIRVLEARPDRQGG
jgi:hypothetical protein